MASTLGGKHSTQVLVGVASLFTAPATTAAPVFTAAGLVVPATPWYTTGNTESGVVLNVDRKIDDIRVDTYSTPVDVVPNTTTVTVDVTLTQDVLANLKIAYGGGTITTTAAGATTPATSKLVLADTLDLLAVCMVGKNVFGKDRLIYIPKVVTGAKVKTTYSRTKTPRSYPTTLSAICPMATIFIETATT